MSVSNNYEICIYVDHGYFSYNVNSLDSALEHAETIMSKGTYRRANMDDSCTIYRVYKVKVKGSGLKSEYPDKFNRT